MLWPLLLCVVRALLGLGVVGWAGSGCYGRWSGRCGSRLSDQHDGLMPGGMPLSSGVTGGFSWSRLDGSVVVARLAGGWLVVMCFASVGG
ncbi:hypothetical protein LPH55_07430 [Xylella taiwanensis]|uniref:Secreted protein n=1 Tax=Xylella taiwanensis TaxID=1444770 RepID=A0ABS8TXR0_9GAMM|nr:hypothetical protein [Xylella taiwanensis]MCD8473289.1 hypothetical protein [Xylella taiwanensis]